MRWFLVFVLAGCTSSAPSTVDASRGHVRLIEAPQGDVAQIMKTRIAAAATEHRSVLLYVGAPWCEPCQRLHKAAESGQLDSELGDVDLITFNSDMDAERLAVANYYSELIPLLVVPGADGRSTDKRMEGSVKGDGAVGQMIPRLRALLGR